MTMAYIVATEEELERAARIWAKSAKWEDPNDPRPQEQAQKAAVDLVTSFLRSPALEAAGARREARAQRTE